MGTGNRLRTALAAGLCKLTRRVLRLTGKGGTTLPGRIALAVDGGILERAAGGMRVILVTGTNGKTTTCRMLAGAVTEAGHACLQNRSGANLLPGITAEFVCGTDRRGEPESRYAVIECDEGALRKVTERLRPEIIVVTNLFRDQLDRYGEVMTVRDKIREGIRNTPGSTLCLNADCPLTASIAEGLPNQVLYYGIDIPVGSQEKRELSDTRYCPRCGTELSYRHYTYSHMGKWLCPHCGNARPGTDVAVTDYPKTGGSGCPSSGHGTRVRMRIRAGEYSAQIRLPAVYNVYNALAAVCAGTALGLEQEELLKSVGETDAAFGRMERFDLGGAEVRMILVKNPAGCDQAIEYVTGTGKDYTIVFCLNDATADGHDISWIWDTDLEKVAADPHRKQVWVSGTRAEDMQLRLKYAGCPEEEIRLEKDYEALAGQIAGSREQVFILPNYTSMLDLREVLLRRTGGDAFWKG